MHSNKYKNSKNKNTSTRSRNDKTVKTGIRIMQWNCNGISAHNEEFKNHIAKNPFKYDIICLQETFLKPSKAFSIPGYSVVRQDREDGAKGGLLALIKEELTYVVLAKTTKIESLRFKIKIRQNQYIEVVNLYISPDKVIGPDERKDLENICMTNNVIILGDLNAKSRLWGSPQTDNRGELFEELIDNYALSVINTGQPTYQKPRGGQSHLDVAIVSASLATESRWEVLNNTMGSDHCPTVININEVTTESEILGLPKFKLSKADWVNFKASCKSSVTEDMTFDADIDRHTANLTDAIISVAEQCIPLTRSNGRLKHNPLPYWNNRCSAAIQERNKARNKLNKNETPENSENYHRLKGIAQRTIKEAAREHWEMYCSTLNRNSNLTSVWNMARKMNGVTYHTKNQSIIHDGKLIDTNQEKAELFAKTFSKICSDENYSTGFQIHKREIELTQKHLFENEPISQTGHDSSILNDNFCLHELRRAIRETKKQSAPGDDKICYEFLQNLPKCSVKALLKLYNRIWLNGEFPQNWRHAIVTPVLKYGKDPTKVSSYRPISLTSTIGKILERLVTNRLSYFVEKNNLLTNVQTGFRKGRSTIDHLIRLQDTINKYNHNNGYTLAVFIDFQSAYDMMWRNGLLIKLRKMGIKGNVFTYIKNFLSNRTIQVRIGNEMSATYTLEEGTPQGSVISSLLFLIYINDLADKIKETETTLYADDSGLFSSGRDLNVLIRKMQNSLNKLADWCEMNGFKISVDKTVAVLFTHRIDKLPQTLKINDEYVKIDNRAKFLGLIFDSKLNWNEHIDYVTKKCQKRINLMRALCGSKWGASKNCLMTYFRAMIRSILDYGSIALDSMTEQNKQKLDTIQSQCLRIACGAARGTSTAALQVETGELPLALRRQQHELQYAVKVRSAEIHPAKHVFEPHWTNNSTKYSNNTTPISTKVQKFFTTENCSFEAPRLPETPPWRSKYCKVDLTVSTGGSKQASPHLLKSLAQQRIEQHESSLCIYTDASKTENGRTAAAFIVPACNASGSARLSDNLSIFTAELTAIKLALLWIKNTEHLTKSNQNIAIFSDSLSSLNAIKSGHSKHRPNLLTEIHRIIDSIDNTITFVWVPSHIGLKYNEQVDSLAVDATKRQDIELPVKFELIEANIFIKNYIIKQWQILWDSGKHGRFYKQIEPLVSDKIKYLDVRRKKDVTITRLRLGTCRLKDYLYKINAADSPNCELCGIAEETVEHFILKCKNSNLCKSVIAACHQRKTTPEIKTILKDKQLIDIVYKNIDRPL